MLLSCFQVANLVKNKAFLNANQDSLNEEEKQFIPCLTSVNLLFRNLLSKADLPTRTSPTRTTLQSILASVKRCLTLPILILNSFEESTVKILY